MKLSKHIDKQIKFVRKAFSMNCLSKQMKLINEINVQWNEKAY